jgi:gamma-glutamyl phosphate reductase
MPKTKRVYYIQFKVKNGSAPSNMCIKGQWKYNYNEYVWPIRFSSVKEAWAHIKRIGSTHKTGLLANKILANGGKISSACVASREVSI